MVLRFWQEIRLNNETIHQERLKFYEQRKEMEAQQNKLLHILHSLEDEAFILKVPGKFPEAFTQTIAELQRRKQVNIATEKVCYLLQRYLKSERETREQFNLRFGDFLPVSIQYDLQTQPIEVLLNGHELAASSKINLIEKVEVGKEQILLRLKDILRRIFKDVKLNFDELTRSDLTDKKHIKALQDLQASHRKELDDLKRQFALQESQATSKHRSEIESRATLEQRKQAEIDALKA
mmetsp:Transcript_15275/g.25834  ORF Transcript_15275/g.25834 Transcript_15275/m.25834 type:complete len:237 (+) Transcript_15275:648-1358(+)